MQASGASSDLTFAIGVDIGGTFTDCTVIDSTGKIASGKVPTTPGDRSIGFFDSIAEAARGLDLDLRTVLHRCARLVHGTTTGTNAIVTRSGARVGLLTTAGHQDVMFIMKGTGRTAGVPPDQLMDLIASRNKPDPIVPRRFIAEIAERIDVDGNVIVPLDLDQARAQIAGLLMKGVEAIAISLLWSFKNPRHEAILKALVKEQDPTIFVTAASDVVGRIGEYERTAATVMNAYIGPLMTQYVERIETRARDSGYSGAVLFSQCAGGAITADEARRLPVLTINSGPVAGVMNSILFARDRNEPNVLTTDMGGTTYDVSLIRDYSATVRESAVLEKYELSIPMLDVESIGTGGGSIAWIDASGRLNVGPKSAGAEPGPVCYGKGGTQPTVTDADVVLGIINPRTFLHGGFELDVEAARSSIAALGERLGLGMYETAAGINRIADSKMSDLLRRMSEFRGLDPRQFAMLAFGGAGPVHAAACAKGAGIRRVIVPLADIASVWSAAGAANADVVVVLLKSVFLDLPIDRAMLDQTLVPLVEQAHGSLRSKGFTAADRRLERSLRMKYKEQVYDIEVPFDDTSSAGDFSHYIADSFRKKYEERFGKNAGFEEGGIQVTAIQIRASGVTAKAPMDLGTAGGDPIVESSRPVYWPELGQLVETAVLETSGRWGDIERKLTGPYIIDLPNTAVVVPPGMSASLERNGCISVYTE